MAFYFEQLNVYQRAAKQTDTILKMIRAFPKEQPVLAEEITRQALAVPMAIARATRHWAPETRMAAYGEAVGHIYATVAVAEVAALQGSLPPNLLASLKQELEALGKTLGALIASIDKKAKEKTPANGGETLAK